MPYTILIYSLLVGVLSFAAYELYIQVMAEQGGGEQVPVQTTQTGEETLSTGDKEMNLKAVVIGSTGATGKYLFAELIKDKVTSTFANPCFLRVCLHWLTFFKCNGNIFYNGS